MSTPSLVAASVSRSFSGVKALQDVDLRLDQREILGLIGPNGSGKSTLVNVVTGTLQPDSGHVLLDDEDVTGSTPTDLARRGVQRTFQTVRLFTSMNVRQNVQVGVISAATVPRQVDERVEQLLAYTGLEAWSDAPASSIPYGTQRRLEIARALATSPKFLLLDEPAAGLNEEESDHLLTLIRRIQHDGTGVLVIDHDLRLILRLCQRVQVLVEGRSLIEGPAAEVRTHPAVIEAYIGARRRSPPELPPDDKEHP